MTDSVDKKAYELIVSVEDRHLRISARGERTRDAVTSIAKEIVEICKQHSADHVLVDVRALQGHLSIFESLTVVATEFQALRRLDVVKKAAIIDRPENASRFRFFEMAARKRHMRFRAFGDGGEAYRWLTSTEHD